MYILGITEIGHNPAACLLKDGKLLSFIEEERLSRIKCSPGIYPIKAVQYCLKNANINLKDVKEIVLSWDVIKYGDQMKTFYSELDEKYKKDPVTKLTERLIFERFCEDKIIYTLKKAFLNLRYKTNEIPPISFVGHHLSHAASTFYCSGFKKALAFVIDGSGEELCTSVFIGEGLNLKLIDKYEIPNSLGWFYSVITEYLGFSSNNQEGTVMGLAAYGKDDFKIRRILEKILYYKNDRYKINPEYIFYGEHTYSFRFTDRLVNELGQPRKKQDVILDKHKNIAFIAQDMLESVVKKMISKYIKEYKIKNICLAGGVAMNCKLNGEILKLKNIDNLFVQPASTDAGSCIGATIVKSIGYGYDPRLEMIHAYWGIEYSNDEIEKSLKIAKVNYKKVDNPSLLAAEYISKGKIIGWFQGRLELGARALGNRSILANPSDPNTKDYLNNSIKFREDWRPFSPSFTEESFKKIFNTNHNPYFMITAFSAYNYKKIMPSVVHVDGTIRPQSVKKEVNFKYWQLIDEFEKLTSIPAVLNTSFNIKGEPIVSSPEDALRCFFSTGLDALFIGDFLIEK
ncbi:MAG: carbamoyltransferase C-terminal domain-containing protein [Clostridiales bacterium]